MCSQRTGDESHACTGDSLGIGMSRVGAPNQMVVLGPLSLLRAVDFGPPLHSLVLLGTPGHDETELLGSFCTPAKDAPTLSAAMAKAEDTASARADAAHAGVEYRGDEEESDSEDEGGGGDFGGGQGESVFGSSGSGGGATAGGKPKAASKSNDVDVNGGDATADDLIDAFGL